MSSYENNVNQGKLNLGLSIIDLCRSNRLNIPNGIDGTIDIEALFTNLHKDGIISSTELKEYYDIINKN